MNDLDSSNQITHVLIPLIAQCIFYGGSLDFRGQTSKTLTACTSIIRTETHKTQYTALYRCTMTNYNYKVNQEVEARVYLTHDVVYRLTPRDSHILPGDSWQGTWHASS